MHARPRRIFVNLGFILRGEQFEVFAIIGEFRLRFFFDKVQTICQRHFAEAVMMPVTFAVGCQMHQLRLVALVVKCAQNALCKCLSAVQQTFKSNGLRDIAIVKKQGNRPTRRQPTEVRTARINVFIDHICPIWATDVLKCLCLARRENRVFDAMSGENFQTFGICRRFCEPHPFGLAPKTVFKIAETPINLRCFVGSICQRQNQMTVRLSDRRTVTTVQTAAFFVRLLNEAIGFGVLFFHPRQECRAEIEAHARVIVENTNDFIVRIQNPRNSVCCVTFKIDALVPIVERGGSILLFHDFEPRVFTRRLIKMSVDTDVFLLCHN